MDTVAIIADEFLPITQTFVYEEITGIKNFNVIVLTTKRSNQDLFPFQKLYVCNDIFKVNSVFTEIIKKHRVKLVHIKFGTTSLNYVRLIKTLNIPFVVSFHGHDASKVLRQAPVLLRYRLDIFPNVDRIITVSPKLKDNLVNAGCPSKKITVLWSGVDLEKFKFKPRKLENGEIIKLLCIGRLTEKKGVQYLIKAFSEVVKNRPNTELLIIGQGPLKQDLQNLISQLKLNEKITMLDFVPHNQIVEIMHKHHIFCLPSVTSKSGNEEGIPNVIKEACATGMPVVSTKHSGIPYLVKNGYNGFLVEEKNVGQLTEKLLYLIDHPEEWERMGFYGRNHVEENFDKYKQARKLEQLYSSLINKKRPTGRIKIKY